MKREQLFKEFRRRRQLHKELILMRKTVAVDLDGVLAQYDNWKGVECIGDPIEGAREFISNLLSEFKVVIHTTRCSQTSNQGYTEHSLEEHIRNWLTKHKFPAGIEIWVREGKPIAVAYIDDRAVCCKPQTNPKAFIEALDKVRELAE